MIEGFSWANDVNIMHKHFNINEWNRYATPKQKRELMKLRMRMLSEEFNETLQAYLQSDKEEFIDGLIDLCVIAIGTLDIYGVDAQKAWDEVYRANMSKQVGVKENRPNPLGLPDLIKPHDWKDPDHSNNYGELDAIMDSEKN